MNKKAKVIVIGLDGCTWNIIKPLVNQGKLPTFAKLMKNGAYGNLESSIPYSTFPAWKCYSTGKNPGKIGGITAFVRPDLNKHDIVLNDSTSFKSEEIWDILNKHKFTCGILNMPTTYPPKNINSFMVSQALHETSNYTYPQDLEKELTDNFKYKIHPKYTYFVDKDKAIANCIEIVNMRFNVAKYLLKKYKLDMFQLTIFYTDHIQHYYWKDMEEKNEKYSSVIEDLWKNIDRNIKNLLKDFKDSYVIIMSDHGFTSLHGEFNILKWLIDNNYTILSNKALRIDILRKIGLSLENLIKIANKFKILDLLKKIIPKKLQMKLLANIPGKTGIIRLSLGDKNIFNWSESKIIPITVPTSSGYYINKNKLSQENIDYEKFRDEVIKKLKNIKSPKGDFLFKNVYKREEIYSGDYVNLCPDIIGAFDEKQTIIPTQSLSNIQWDFSKSNWSGVHKLHGIFCISGPEIKKNKEIENAKIIDLAPTILHLFNVPIPVDMDGKVLLEIFQENSIFKKNKIIYSKSQNEKYRIKKKILKLKENHKI